MTSPTSANKHRSRRSAFTLVELLAVIGIILLLIGILLPALIRALALAQRARISSELSSISTALEQYRGDYNGNYPPVNVPDTGAAVLGKALLALGPTADPISSFNAVSSYLVGDWVMSGGTVYESIAANPSTSFAPPNATYWQTVTSPGTAPTYSSTSAYPAGSVISDNGSPANLYVAITLTPAGTALTSTLYFAPFSWADGGGIGQYRVRHGGALKSAYLQPDRFKVNGTDILDKNGYPILYFPASPGSHNPSIAQGYIASYTDTNTSHRKAASLFDPTDNLTVFRVAADTDFSNANKRFCAMLGDVNVLAPSASTNADGSIDATGENSLAAGVPFILWSPGANGVYGPAFTGDQPTNTRNVDDVTNFR